MRGVTLIELLAAVSLFLVLLYFGYHAFDSQARLLKNITARTEPEEESNYRLLLIKHVLERSSSRLKIDPLFEGAPTFFHDLSFGQTSQPNAFSIAHVSGSVIGFVRTGLNYRLPAAAAVEERKTYLMAGADMAGNYTWNYAEAESVWSIADATMAKFEPHIPGAELERGKLIAADVHGFLYQNQTLYWVSPTGTLQPYLSGVDSFQYEQSGALLRVRWKVGLVQMEFRCAL